MQIGLAFNPLSGGLNILGSVMRYWSRDRNDRVKEWAEPDLDREGLMERLERMHRTCRGEMPESDNRL